MPTLDLDRRFGGIRRLYGDAALTRLQTAHVCVIGIGGVGSWAAEALARSAIGRLTLIDLDHVAISNVNRQAHALDGQFGVAKVSAMAERIRLINPQCQVNTIEDFVEPDHIARYIDPSHGYDYVVDAIDNVRSKIALIAHCRAQALPLVVSGSAGGRIDPSRIMVDDLARTHDDPIAAKLRAGLRKQYDYPRDPKKRFGVECVYSTEPIRYPTADMNAPPETSAPQGLNCAGFGSSMCVTASFGMLAAARVLLHLTQ